MARRRSFSQLQSSLRAELGRDNAPAVRSSDMPALRETLNRNYQIVYEEDAWPFLRTIFDKMPLVAGERYYDFPAGLDYERILDVAVWQGNVPLHPIRGIGFAQYATYDPATDNRSDPVLRWDIAYDTAQDQFEVWPIPASNANTIQFIGIKAFAPLVNDADICLVDDILVVLPSAIEFLARSKSPDANVKMVAAQRRLDRAKGRGATNRPTYRLGLGPAPSSTSNRTTVRIAGR